MSDPAGCGCDDCCRESLPVFLDGDERTVELRELAFGLLLRDRTPVPPSELAGLSGADESSVAAALDGLAWEGRIDRDNAGRVMGSAGLTLADGPHGLEIDGHAFRTCCAWMHLASRRPWPLTLGSRRGARCAVDRSASSFEPGVRAVRQERDYMALGRRRRHAGRLLHAHRPALL